MVFLCLSLTFSFLTQKCTHLSLKQPQFLKNMGWFQSLHSFSSFVQLINYHLFDHHGMIFHLFNAIVHVLKMFQMNQLRSLLSIIKKIISKIILCFKKWGISSYLLSRISVVYMKTVTFFIIIFPTLSVNHGHFYWLFQRQLHPIPVAFPS